MGLEPVSPCLDTPLPPANGDPIDYQSVKSRGEEAVLAGDLERALELFEQAMFAAELLDDPDLVDRAVCNRALVAIELGAGAETLAPLRRILLRSGDDTTCWLASYHVSRIYELDKSFKKSLFYAQTARDRAYRLEREDWRAASHNQIGNLLLAVSRCDEAIAEYERALELIASGEDVWRARVLDNLGYCRVLQGRQQEAFSLLIESLRTLRRAGAERFQVSTHLDLSFAYLEVGRYRPARRHGEAALRLALETEQSDAEKNALFLLGQAATMAGDAAEAERWFDRLQAGFYPDTPMVADLLMAVDVRPLVNLRA